MKFSVLLPVYIGTRAYELDTCLSSLLKQTAKTDEIVLILDGPVDEAIHDCITRYDRTLPIYQLGFPSNRGLGAALQDGLNACTNDLVARVDSDDRCVEHRFELQLSYFRQRPETSVIGGILREWYRIRGQLISIDRNVPLTPSQVYNVSKSRNPLNHPTVMFRKSDVLQCGGYERFEGFEDYFLWVKMLQQNFLLSNLPDVLVETDIDRSYFSRRGGFKYISKELRLAKKLHQIGHFSSLEFFFFFISRLPFRLSPNNLRRFLYIFFLRDRIGRRIFTDSH